ncbi:MAG TPA: NAD(P)/FAD-dependent oxidoreductase, partial [Anaerolineales bacterium]
MIIGGGHNGLVAAAYLAKQGWHVLVLERRRVLGGAAATEEVFSGFRVNTGAGDAGLFLPQIVTDLQLQNYGLEFIESPVVALALQPDGPPLTLWRHPERAAEEIARFSEADARRHPAFLAETTRYARILDSMRTLAPPLLPKYRYGELLSWLPAGMNLRRLGKRQMMAFLRMLPMPVTDFLDEWFETPLLKAALGFSGVAGSMQGPR